jgi:hypothetical protein
MGVPITSYTIMRALTDDAPKSFEFELAKAAFDPFGVFAFFLHDPIKHADFHKTLTDEFYHFHNIAGAHLCFFALVNPPEQWERRAVRRDHVNFFRSWEMEQLQDPQVALHSQDPGLACMAMAEALSIPYDSLPALVITNDFRLNRFFWVRTCSDHVGEQFARLTSVANDFCEELQESSVPSRSEAGQELLFSLLEQSGMDLCNGAGKGGLVRSMASVLSDILEFVAASDRKTDPSIRRQAQKNAEASIQRLIDEMSIVKQGYAALSMAPKDADLQVLEELGVKLARLVSMMHRRRSEDLSSFQPVLEVETFDILRIGLDVTDFLSHMVNEDRETLRHFDFTPGLICLTKVFEMEINLSVVHWLRKKHGVQLPQYFNRVQPGLTVKLSTSSENGKSIDFNARKGSYGERWLPPGIGQSLRIVREQINPSELPLPWSREEWDFLINRWGRIVAVRNRAAHTELVTLQEAEDIKKMILTLGTQGIFRSMATLKQAVKP